MTALYPEIEPSHSDTVRRHSQKLKYPGTVRPCHSRLPEMARAGPHAGVQRAAAVRHRRPSDLLAGGNRINRDGLPHRLELGGGENLDANRVAEPVARALVDQNRMTDSL